MPIHFAVQKSFHEIICILSEYGADLDCKDIVSDAFIICSNLILFLTLYTVWHDSSS